MLAVLRGARHWPSSLDLRFIRSAKAEFADHLLLIATVPRSTHTTFALIPGPPISTNH